MWPLIKLLPITTNFRFVAFSRIAAVISVIAVIGSLAMVLIPFQPPCGGLACGIDFKGGTLLEISTAPKAVDLGAVRQTLEAARMGDVQVQAFGSETSAMVRFQTPDGAHPDRQPACDSDERSRYCQGLPDAAAAAYGGSRGQPIRAGRDPRLPQVAARPPVP